MGALTKLDQKIVSKFADNVSEIPLVLEASYALAIVQGVEQQVAILDSQGRIVWVNDAWKDFGTSNGLPDDFVWAGKNYLDACASGQADQDLSAATVAKGVANVLAGRSDKFDFEYPCHSPTKDRWFLMQVKSLDVPGERFFYVAHFNVTNRKRSELRQQEINDLYEVSQKIGRIGSWTRDMRHGPDAIYSWSTQTRLMFEVDDAEVGETNVAFMNAVHPEDRAKIKAHFKQSLVDQKPYEIEYRIVMTDGRVKYLAESCGTVFSADGRPLVSTGTLQDITDRKLAEQARADFAAMMTHELRTPLTSIKGSLALISGAYADQIPPEVARLLDVAQQNSERLLGLLSDVLDAEKCASGRMEYFKEDLDIATLLTAEIEAEQGFGAEFGVSFDLSGAATPVMASCDAKRMQQVVANLLSNAAKFSPKGGVVKISLTVDSGMICVSVTDQGPGIPAEQHDRVFERYSQIDNAVQRQRVGTGLGLPFVKEVIEEHGGTVDFESAPGIGTRFFFELPLLPS